ncbi:MAG TPA: serine hydrolase domain-containing protein [Longimicrobiales bacterium]|nr:serine hydrolase domain-containing protein [Longimicrobiales bacterium]
MPLLIPGIRVPVPALRLPSIGRVPPALLLAGALGLLPARPDPLAAQRPPVAALTGSTSTHREAAAATHAFAVELMEREGLPALSIAVGVGGRIVHSEGLGFADLEQRVPATPLTRFRIGSVSKSVTSAALGLLAEQGRLDLDAPVQRYVPAFPEKRWPISARQVAGHIAGIRHYRGMENLLARRWPDVRTALEIFSADSLLFEPGTRYEYSSYGWNLLSAVAEGAAQESFLGYMRRAVFEPLGIRDIVAEHTDSIIPFRARFYERAADGALRNAPYVDNSYKWAGGGFLGTSEDLVRFGFGIMKPGLLEQRTIDMLFTSQRLRDGSETGYGIGWSVGADSAGRRRVAHTGGSVGGRAVLLLYPEHDVVVAMLSNAGHAPMSVANAALIAGHWLQESGQP